MKKKGGSKQKATRSKAAKVTQRTRRAGKPRARSRDKYSKVGAALQDASPKELAALLEALNKGRRKVPPGVTLNPFEAGFLAGELQYSLHPKRRRRKKIENDHMHFFPPSK